MDKIRGLIIVIAFIAIFLALFFFVQFTGFLFDIQQQYANSPTWLIAIYIGGVALIALVGLWLIYKFSQFGSKAKKISTEKIREVVDDESFNKKISTLQEQGANTDEIEDDWKNLLSMRESESVSIALFGEVNVGKSSLIHALTNKNIAISAQGGKTQTIDEYPFTHGERRYTLIDMPGLNEVAGSIISETLVYEKAIKSHVVVWLLDEEITQSSYENYIVLKQFDKPIIIAINKADYYSENERSKINQRIQEKLESTPPVVWITSATQKTIEKHYDDGHVESSQVAVAADIHSLIAAIEAITFDRLTLDNRLNDSYFKQLESDMDKSLSVARQTPAEQVVKSYSQKAIFAGMAAVGPGTDVLLQGYLGIGMARSLCEIYHVDMQSVDLENTLSLLNGKIKKELALILALIGNVFKAFPGIGTVAGGAAHAVAYGLIFESVGKAMTASLEKYNGINQAYVAGELQDILSNNLENRATQIVKTVIFNRR